MAFLRKQSGPIDRAVRQLDEQIAALQRQIRAISHDSAGRAGAAAPSMTQSATETLTHFVKEMLKPPKSSVAPSYHVRRDFFDVGNEPLKELEAEPIAFAGKTDADLFTQAQSPASAMAGTATEPPQSQQKLAHYLSAGSFRAHKQLKRVRRETRNRFFMWLGLSFVALWLIYFVVQ